MLGQKWQKGKLAILYDACTKMQQEIFKYVLRSIKKKKIIVIIFILNSQTLLLK